MGYVWQRWLAAELRATGLTVVEVEGWQNRGRPASTGNFNPGGQSTTHHTGSPTSPTNKMPTLRTLIVGRPDLPGPLSQVGVAYDGVVYVIAAGRANHAGRIGKSGVPGMPYGYDGNALAIGDEVDTNGTQALPPAQRRAIALVNAVVLRHFKRGPEYAHRHADISGTGKWDIGSLTTAQLRADAAAAHTQEDDMFEKEDRERMKGIERRQIATSEKDARRIKQLRAALADISKEQDAEKRRDKAERAREADEAIEAQE